MEEKTKLEVVEGISPQPPLVVVACSECKDSFYRANRKILPN